MRDDERRFELSPGEEEEEEEGAGNFAGIVVEVQLITGNILKSPLRCFGAAVVAFLVAGGESAPAPKVLASLAVVGIISV